MQIFSGKMRICINHLRQLIIRQRVIKFGKGQSCKRHNILNFLFAEGIPSCTLSVMVEPVKSTVRVRLGYAAEILKAKTVFYGKQNFSLRF